MTAFVERCLACDSPVIQLTDSQWVDLRRLYRSGVSSQQWRCCRTCLTYQMAWAVDPSVDD